MKETIKSKKCVADCKIYSNLNSGELEIYHHKDCPNYPESLSSVLDEYKQKFKRVDENDKRLRLEIKDLKSTIDECQKFIVDGIGIQKKRTSQ